MLIYLVVKKSDVNFFNLLKQSNIAMLDEIDSGLDIDAIKTVAELINKNGIPKHLI